MIIYLYKILLQTCRYYFEKPTAAAAATTLQNKCNLHSRNLAKSLNELYTEPIAAPPPPSAIKAGILRGGNNNGRQQQQQQQYMLHTLPRPPQQFSDLPQEFPLTRSVSTTTDIYTNSLRSLEASHDNLNDNLVDNNAIDKKLQCNSNNRRRNVATNTRFISDCETQTNARNEYVQLRNNGHPLNVNTSVARKTSAAYNNDANFNKRQQHNRQINTMEQHKNQQQQRSQDYTDDIQLQHDAQSNDDDEDEEPQKLCGLKRGIRKTKDELFEEFCKRAGVRPKPKNIYYISNEEEQQQQQEQNNVVVGSNDGPNENTHDYEHGGTSDVQLLRPTRTNNTRHSQHNDAVGTRRQRQIYSLGNNSCGKYL